MDVNRISGYIPGKIVTFLMQVCKSGMASTRKIWLTRHGESEMNRSGRIGGDSNLAGSGEMCVAVAGRGLLGACRGRAGSRRLCVAALCSHSSP